MKHNTSIKEVKTDDSEVEAITIEETLKKLLAQDPIYGKSDYSDLPGARTDARLSWRSFAEFPHRRNPSSSPQQRRLSVSSVELRKKSEEARLRREKITQQREARRQRQQAQQRERRRQQELWEHLQYENAGPDGRDILSNPGLIIASSPLKGSPAKSQRRDFKIRDSAKRANILKVHKSTARRLNLPSTSGDINLNSKCSIEEVVSTTCQDDSQRREATSQEKSKMKCEILTNLEKVIDEVINHSSQFSPGVFTSDFLEQLDSPSFSKKEDEFDKEFLENDSDYPGRKSMTTTLSSSPQVTSTTSTPEIADADSSTPNVLKRKTRKTKRVNYAESTDSDSDSSEYAPVKLSKTSGRTIKPVIRSLEQAIVNASMTKKIRPKKQKDDKNESKSQNTDDVSSSLEVIVGVGQTEAKKSPPERASHLPAGAVSWSHLAPGPASPYFLPPLPPLVPYLHSACVYPVSFNTSTPSIQQTAFSSAVMFSGISEMGLPPNPLYMKSGGNATADSMTPSSHSFSQLPLSSTAAYTATTNPLLLPVPQLYSPLGSMHSPQLAMHMQEKSKSSVNSDACNLILPDLSPVGSLPTVTHSHVVVPPNFLLEPPAASFRSGSTNNELVLTPSQTRVPECGPLSVAATKFSVNNILDIANKNCATDKPATKHPDTVVLSMNSTNTLTPLSPPTAGKQISQQSLPQQFVSSANKGVGKSPCGSTQFSMVESLPVESRSESSDKQQSLRAVEAMLNSAFQANMDKSKDSISRKAILESPSSSKQQKEEWFRDVSSQSSGPSTKLTSASDRQKDLTESCLYDNSFKNPSSYGAIKNAPSSQKHHPQNIVTPPHLLPVTELSHHLPSSSFTHLPQPQKPVKSDFFAPPPAHQRVPSLLQVSSIVPPAHQNVPSSVLEACARQAFHETQCILAGPAAKMANSLNKSFTSYNVPEPTQSFKLKQAVTSVHTHRPQPTSSHLETFEQSKQSFRINETIRMQMHPLENVSKNNLSLTPMRPDFNAYTQVNYLSQGRTPVNDFQMIRASTKIVSPLIRPPPPRLAAPASVSLENSMSTSMSLNSTWGNNGNKHKVTEKQGLALVRSQNTNHPDPYSHYAGCQGPFSSPMSYVHTHPQTTHSIYSSGTVLTHHPSSLPSYSQQMHHRTSQHLPGTKEPSQNAHKSHYENSPSNAKTPNNSLPAKSPAGSSFRGVLPANTLPVPNTEPRPGPAQTQYNTHFQAPAAALPASQYRQEPWPPQPGAGMNLPHRPAPSVKSKQMVVTAASPKSNACGTQLGPGGIIPLHARNNKLVGSSLLHALDLGPSEPAKTCNGQTTKPAITLSSSLVLTTSNLTRPTASTGGSKAAYDYPLTKSQIKQEFCSHSDYSDFSSKGLSPSLLSKMIDAVKTRAVSGTVSKERGAGQGPAIAQKGPALQQNISSTPSQPLSLSARIKAEIHSGGGGGSSSSSLTSSSSTSLNQGDKTNPAFGFHSPLKTVSPQLSTTTGQSSTGLPTQHTSRPSDVSAATSSCPNENLKKTTASQSLSTRQAALIKIKQEFSSDKNLEKSQNISTVSLHAGNSSDSHSSFQQSMPSTTLKTNLDNSKIHTSVSVNSSTSQSIIPLVVTAGETASQCAVSVASINQPSLTEFTRTKSPVGVSKSVPEVNRNTTLASSSFSVIVTSSSSNILTPGDLLTRNQLPKHQESCLIDLNKIKTEHMSQASKTHQHEQKGSSSADTSSQMVCESSPVLAGSPHISSTVHVQKLNLRSVKQEPRSAQELTVHSQTPDVRDGSRSTYNSVLSKDSAKMLPSGGGLVSSVITPVIHTRVTTSLPSSHLTSPLNSTSSENLLNSNPPIQQSKSLAQDLAKSSSPENSSSLSLATLLRRIMLPSRTACSSSKQVELSSADEHTKPMSRDCPQVSISKSMTSTSSELRTAELTIQGKLDGPEFPPDTHSSSKTDISAAEIPEQTDTDVQNVGDSEQSKNKQPMDIKVPLLNEAVPYLVKTVDLPFDTTEGTAKISNTSNSTLVPVAVEVSGDTSNESFNPASVISLPETAPACTRTGGPNSPIAQPVSLDHAAHTKVAVVVPPPLSINHTNTQPVKTVSYKANDDPLFAWYTASPTGTDRSIFDDFATLTSASDQNSLNGIFTITVSVPRSDPNSAHICHADASPADVVQVKTEVEEAEPVSLNQKEVIDLCVGDEEESMQVNGLGSSTRSCHDFLTAASVKEQSDSTFTVTVSVPHSDSSGAHLCRTNSLAAEVVQVKTEPVSLNQREVIDLCAGDYEESIQVDTPTADGIKCDETTSTLKALTMDASSSGEFSAYTVKVSVQRTMDGGHKDLAPENLATVKTESNTEPVCLNEREVIDLCESDNEERLTQTDTLDRTQNISGNSNVHHQSSGSSSDETFKVELCDELEASALKPIKSDPCSSELYSVQLTVSIPSGDTAAFVQPETTLAASVGTGSEKTREKCEKRTPLLSPTKEPKQNIMSCPCTTSDEQTLSFQSNHIEEAIVVGDDDDDDDVDEGNKGTKHVQVDKSAAVHQLPRTPERCQMPSSSRSPALSSPGSASQLSPSGSKTSSVLSPSYNVGQTLASIATWSNEEVTNWLQTRKLDKICPNFSSLDGRGLQRMAFEYQRDPDMFYTRVKKTLGLSFFQTLVICRSMKDLTDKSDD